MLFNNLVVFISNSFLYRPEDANGSVLTEIYYLYSLLFLIGRTFCVALISADIYDESRKPIEFLNSVSTEVWCDDTQRLLQQVTNGTFALSGKKFFYLTKSLILKV